MNFKHIYPSTPPITSRPTCRFLFFLTKWSFLVISLEIRSCLMYIVRLSGDTVLKKTDSFSPSSHYVSGSSPSWLVSCLPSCLCAGTFSVALAQVSLWQALSQSLWVHMCFCFGGFGKQFPQCYGKLLDFRTVPSLLHRAQNLEGRVSYEVSCRAQHSSVLYSFRVDQFEVLHLKLRFPPRI